MCSILDSAEFSNEAVDVTVADNVGKVVVRKASSRSVSSGDSDFSVGADARLDFDEGGGISAGGRSWSLNRSFSGSGGSGSGLGIGNVPPDSTFFVRNSQMRCSSFNL